MILKHPIFLKKKLVIFPFTVDYLLVNFNKK